MTYEHGDEVMSHTVYALKEEDTIRNISSSGGLFYPYQKASLKSIKAQVECTEYVLMIT